MAILKGNIAPEGSVLKYSACAMDQREVDERRGPGVQPPRRTPTDAVVNNEINPGEVVIIRYEGPARLRHARDADDRRGHRLRRADRTALWPWRFADGRFSGATRGAAIGHVHPRGCSPAVPIAFIEEGDLVAYGVENRTIDLTGVHWRCPARWRKATKVLAERAKAGDAAPGAPQGLLQAVYRPRPVRYEGGRPGIK